MRWDHRISGCGPFPHRWGWGSVVSNQLFPHFSSRAPRRVRGAVFVLAHLLLTCLRGLF